MAKYICVKNKNSTSPTLELEFLTFMGASTERGLTGQGLGFKFVVAAALRDNLEIARSSWDSTGSYIARFEAREKVIGGRSERQIVCRVQRPGVADEVLETTQLVRIAESSWSQSPLGDSYPILRELILDAADEDANFLVGPCDSISYAPRGHTHTFITATPELSAVAGDMPYYFKRAPQMKRVSDGLMITEPSAVQEYRLFITVAGAPIAYVAHTSGDGDEMDDAAFDYILVETPENRFASLPKRLVEDPYRAGNHIAQNMRLANVDVLAKVFRNVAANGMEARWHWPTYESYYFGGWAKVREAFRLAFGNRPIVPHADSFEVADAVMAGDPYAVVGEKLYELGKAAGIETLRGKLNLRDPNEDYLDPLNADQRRLLAQAIQYLIDKFGGDWKQGHTFMAITGKTLGWHLPYESGRDTIAINFQKLPTAKDVAGVLWHEVGHHVEGSDSRTWDNHGPRFVAALTKLTFGGE